MKTHTPYRRTLHACYAASATQAVVNNLAPLLFVSLQDMFALSFEHIGLLVMINYGVQLLTDALCFTFADRFSLRRLILAAHVLSALGLVLLGLLPLALPAPYLGLVLAVVVYAVGGGLLEVLVSPIVDALPSEAKAASMSLLHSFYCWGQVLVVLGTTVALRAVGGGLWWALPVAWAAIPVCNALNFLRAPLPALAATHEKMPLRRLLVNRRFLLALFLMVCAGASEQAMAQWASLFAERGLHVSKIVGDLLGPCLFAVFMGVGRTLYGLFGAKWNLPRALGACAALCAVCYVVAALSGNPFIALAGCALTGLAVSLMWPGTLTLGTTGTFAQGGTALFALLALGGDAGCSVGPWLTGIVSGAAQQSRWALDIGQRAGLDAAQIGIKSGLLAAAVFPLALLLGIFAMRRHGRRGEP